MGPFGTILELTLDLIFSDIKLKGCCCHQSISYSNTTVISHIFACFHKLLEYILSSAAHVAPARNPKRHWVHLFPGGGMVATNSIYNLTANINIITTQNYINQICQQAAFPAKYLSLVTARLMLKSESTDVTVASTKQYFSHQKLTVCFTCLGNPSTKGYSLFCNVANLAVRTFDAEKINFVTCGNINQSIPEIKCKGLLSQQELCKFYKEEVDVYFNADTGIEYNGWPLGIEALLSGCVLMTTDPKGENQHYFNFTTDEIFIITPTTSEIMIVSFLKSLLEDRSLCQKIATSAEYKFRQLGNFSKTMKPILDDIIQTSACSPDGPCK